MYTYQYIDLLGLVLGRSRDAMIALCSSVSTVGPALRRRLALAWPDVVDCSSMYQCVDIPML